MSDAESWWTKRGLENWEAVKILPPGWNHSAPGYGWIVGAPIPNTKPRIQYNVIVVRDDDRNLGVEGGFVFSWKCLEPLGFNVTPGLGTLENSKEIRTWLNKQN